MVVLLDEDRTFWYVCLAERSLAPEYQTRWQLEHPDQDWINIIAEAGNNAVKALAVAPKVVQALCRGWQNLLDSSGNAVEYSTETCTEPILGRQIQRPVASAALLARLPSRILTELATAALRGTLTDDVMGE